MSPTILPLFLNSFIHTSQRPSLGGRGGTMADRFAFQRDQDRLAVHPPCFSKTQACRLEFGYRLGKKIDLKPIATLFDCIQKTGCGSRRRGKCLCVYGRGIKDDRFFRDDLSHFSNSHYHERGGRQVLFTIQALFSIRKCFFF